MPVRLHDSRIQFTPEGYLMKRLVGILSAAAITAVCSTALAQAPAAPETNSATARDAQNPGGAPTGPRVRAGAKPETNADMARAAGVEVSRIAHGVPVGGELELVDGTTLSHSLMGRQRI